MDTPQTHRPIRSFVLRQGLCQGQQRAYDTLMPVLGVGYQPQVADLDAVFGRAAQGGGNRLWHGRRHASIIAQARRTPITWAWKLHGPGVAACSSWWKSASWAMCG